MPGDLLGPTLEEVQIWLRSASGWVPAGFVLNVEPVNARLGRVLVVEDDPGIATQLARGLTRAGYETGSNPNGTGLGLAIVHRLVTSNGSTAKLTETPGGGLTAVLEFPGVPAPNNTAPNNTGPNNTGAEYPSSAQDLASL
jgi:nitrogen-specific signal transduction histidine kinase